MKSLVTVIILAIAVIGCHEDKPDAKPVFTDLVQTSLKGVVHLQAPSWQGSGFVVGPRLIVTARHCTTGVTDFLMTLNNECQIRAARAYKHELYDLSYVRIDDLACVNDDIDHRIQHGGKHKVVLSPVPLGSIEDCVQGQDIYIVGSPYGKVNFNTVSRGVISGLNRDWDSIDPYSGESYGWSICFTSDSSASPGNSGGALFSFDGKVRGILVGGYNSTVNCLMPSDLFMHDLESIRLKFAMDRYKREEAVDHGEYYNYEDDTEYYD